MTLKKPLLVHKWFQWLFSTWNPWSFRIEINCWYCPTSIREYKVLSCLCFYRGHLRGIFRSLKVHHLWKPYAVLLLHWHWSYCFLLDVFEMLIPPPPFFSPVCLFQIPPPTTSGSWRPKCASSRTTTTNCCHRWAYIISTVVIRDTFEVQSKVQRWKKVFNHPKYCINNH